MDYKQVSAFDAGYSNLLDSVRADRTSLEGSLADIKSGQFLPRLKEDLSRLCNSGIDWANRLETTLQNAKKSGKPDEDFVRSFALEYADFSAKRAEFAVKLECAKAYSSAVYSGSQNISDARSDLLKTASIYKEKEIKAAFAGLSGDLKLASMVSLSELFGAELSPSQKALKHIALISQAQAIDSSVAERMLWHTHSEIYLKGHTEKFADVLREALKSVRDESKSTLDAQTVTFKKGKVVLDKSGRPVEEKLIDAGVRKKLGDAYSEVEVLLAQASASLKQDDSKKAAKLFKQAAEQIVSVREAANKRIGEAVYANTGISPSQWKEVVADAAVLGMGVIGAKVGGPAAPLAASAYFAVKGGFYTHLGIVTKNNDLVLAGMLMMAPLMLGTAAKGMLAVASRSGSEALTTGAYSLVLSERAIGVYFTGSMGYNAIRGAVEGAKYGYTPELVKETVQNAVFGAFGLGVATGRLSAVKSSLKEALEGAKVIGVGQGIKKGSGAKVIPIRTEVERPAEAVEVGREGMGGKKLYYSRSTPDERHGPESPADKRSVFAPRGRRSFEEADRRAMRAGAPTTGTPGETSAEILTRLESKAAGLRSNLHPDTYSLISNTITEARTAEARGENIGARVTDLEARVGLLERNQRYWSNLNRLNLDSQTSLRINDPPQRQSVENFLFTRSLSGAESYLSQSETLAYAFLQRTSTARTRLNSLNLTSETKQALLNNLRGYESEVVMNPFKAKDAGFQLISPEFGRVSTLRTAFGGREFANLLLTTKTALESELRSIEHNLVSGGPLVAENAINYLETILPNLQEVSNIRGSNVPREMRLSTQNEVAFNTALNTVEAELLSGEVNRANGLLNDINTAHASGAVGVQIFCMRWRVSGLVPHLVGEGQDLVSGLTRKGLPPDEASDFANAHTDLLARLEAIQNTLEDIRGRALTRGAPLDETTLSQFSGALKKFETSLTALETSDQLHITTPKDGGPRNISELTTLRNMLKDSEALETSLKGHLPPEVQLPQLSNEYYARAAIALGKPVAGDPQALRNDPIIKGQAQIEVFDEFLFRLGIATRHDTMSRLKARNPATYRTWMDGKIAEYSKGSETDKIKARQGLINGGRSALDSASSQQVGRVFETLGTDSLHVIYTDLAQAQKPGGRARLLPRLISGEMRLGPAEPALEIVFARLAHVFDLETIDPNVQRDILDEMTNYSYRSGDGARPFEQILRRNLTNATVCQRVLDHMYTQDPVGGTRLIDLFLMDATQPFNREVDRVTVPAYLKELGENYLGRFQVQQKPIWVGKWSNLFTRDAIEVNDKLTRDLGDALSTKSNPLYAPRWWLNPRYAMRSPWSSGFFGGLGSSLSIGTNVFVTLLPLIVAFDSGNVVLTRERPAAEWYLRPAGNLTHKLFFEQTPQEELDKRLEKAVTAAELPESLVPKLSGLTARQISDFEVVVAKFKEAVDGKDILDNVTRKFVSPGSKETAEQYIQELQTIQGYISKGYWAASSGNTDRKIKSCAAFSQMEIPSREHKVNNPVFEGVRTDKTLSPLIADHLSDLLDKGFSKEQIINVWNVSGMAAATFDKYLVRLSNLSSVYSSSIAKRLCTGKDAEFKWINITQFELALQKAEGLSTGQVSRELTFAKIVLETVVDASDTQNLLKFAESNSVSEAQRVDVEIALSKVLYSPVPGTNVTLMAVYVDNPTRLFDQLTDFVDFHTKNGTVNVARLNSEEFDIYRLFNKDAHGYDVDGLVLGTNDVWNWFLNGRLLSGESTDVRYKVALAVYDAGVLSGVFKVAGGKVPLDDVILSKINAITADDVSMSKDDLILDFTETFEAYLRSDSRPWSQYLRGTELSLDETTKSALYNAMYDALVSSGIIQQSSANVVSAIRSAVARLSQEDLSLEQTDLIKKITTLFEP